MSFIEDILRNQIFEIDFSHKLVNMCHDTSPHGINSIVETDGCKNHFESKIRFIQISRHLRGR